MVPSNNLGPDLSGKAINETKYRGFDLKGYSDSDYARCNMDRKSTLGGKTGGLDQISNKDATILYCLENGVKVDYAKLIWEDIIHKLRKKTREKVVPYPSFFQLHSESASGHDALANSTAEADPRNSALNDSIPVQQVQTRSAGDGLKLAHTDSGTNEESIADEISKKIKLEDLSYLLKDTISAIFTPD
uniref:Uncharacterized protein n=1 Tax=Tanacetum cinerariifolium TaxID=118510 RepID=A0A6L2P4M8_TANCI|nr:hypothetical protein [Tanacetum cinerariifolium]